MYPYDDSRKRFREPRDEDRWNAYVPPQPQDHYYPPPRDFERYDDRVPPPPNSWGGGDDHRGPGPAARDPRDKGGAWSRQTVRCYIHDKVRTMPNMFEESAGRFRCREGMPCRTPANARDVASNASSSVGAVTSVEGAAGEALTKCVCVSATYIEGENRRKEGPADEVNRKKHLFSMAILLVHENDEIMLFEGRVAVPADVVVSAEECARVGINEEGVQQGASIETVKSIISAFTRRNNPLIGYDVSYVLNTVGLGRLPTKLFYDIKDRHTQEGAGATIEETAQRMLGGFGPINNEGDRCRATLALYRIPKA